MKENQWKGFNNSLKSTLKMNSIRAFRVEEALETPQESDVMAILIQYMCPNNSDSAAAAESDSSSNVGRIQIDRLMSKFLATKCGLGFLQEVQPWGILLLL
ncbi:hypothetical protein ACE6H2_025057 [Prunus campanulata]